VCNLSVQSFHRGILHDANCLFYLTSYILEDVYANMSYGGFCDGALSLGEEFLVVWRDVPPSSSKWILFLHSLTLDTEGTTIHQNVWNIASLPGRFESLTHVTPPFTFIVWIIANICKTIIVLYTSWNLFLLWRNPTSRNVQTVFLL
jgi:hypothetical protein